MDLKARDEDIPLEHLAMTKKYVEQERERANLFNDVAFSSGEFRNVEALVQQGAANGGNSSFLEQRGVMRRPTTCSSPSRNREVGNQPTLNTQGVMEDDLFDPMDAFKRLRLSPSLSLSLYMGNALFFVLNFNVYFMYTFFSLSLSYFLSASLLV